MQVVSNINARFGTTLTITQANSPEVGTVFGITSLIVRHQAALKKADGKTQEKETKSSDEESMGQQKQQEPCDVEAVFL